MTNFRRWTIETRYYVEDVNYLSEWKDLGFGGFFFKRSAHNYGKWLVSLLHASRGHLFEYRIVRAKK